MIPGEMVRVIDTHIALGTNQKSYILHPGEAGLITENSIVTATLTLLISGELMEVEERAVEVLK